MTSPRWTPLREGEAVCGRRYLWHHEHVGQRPAWRTSVVRVLAVHGPTLEVELVSGAPPRYELYPCELSEIMMVTGLEYAPNPQQEMAL